MRYGPQNMTDMMGIGNYVGEMRRGPNGQLYQWVEGVDGLGNPIGFWRAVKKIASVATSAIPGLGPIKGAVQQFCKILPQLPSSAQQTPGIQPFISLGTRICKVLGKVGIAGAEGAIMEAPDGQLYEVVESIGEDGTVRPTHRPVRLCIPATIVPRRARQGVRPVVQAASTVPAMQPVVPVRQLSPAPMARRVQVQRFR